MKTHIRYIGVMVIFLSMMYSSAMAQVKYVNEFLNIGVGARAHGMFGSVVATTDDSGSGYWNVAGLSHVDVPFQFSAMHTGWFGNIANYDYLSVAKSFSGDHKAYGGLTIIRMAIDNIPNTINLIGPDGTVNYDNITTFSAADYAGLLSYARRIGETGNWSMGGSVKIIRRTIGEFGSSWGFGTDLGFQYRGSKMSFGLSLRDITTTYNTWTFNLTEEEKNVFQRTGNEIPASSTESTLPRMIVGLAFHDGNPNRFTYLVEVDLNMNTDGRESALIANENFAIDPSAGLELGYASKVFVRAGIGNIQRLVNAQNYTEREIEYQPNIGLGLKLGNLAIDYALANVGGVAGINESHIFSLSLDIIPVKKAPKPTDDKVTF